MGSVGSRVVVHPSSGTRAPNSWCWPSGPESTTRHRAQVPISWSDPSARVGGGGVGWVTGNGPTRVPGWGVGWVTRNGQVCTLDSAQKRGGGGSNFLKSRRF